MNQERSDGDGQTEDRKSTSSAEGAPAVYERMFKVDAVRSIITDTERGFCDESPFKGVTKLLKLTRI
eukprot:985319-Prorocentrum_lima.AAC.1